MGANPPFKHSWVVGTIKIMSLNLSKWWFCISKIQGLLVTPGGNSHCIQLHLRHAEVVQGILRVVKWQWPHQEKWKSGSFYTQGNWVSERATSHHPTADLKIELKLESRSHKAVPGSSTCGPREREERKEEGKKEFLCWQSCFLKRKAGWF